MQTNAPLVLNEQNNVNHYNVVQKKFTSPEVYVQKGGRGVLVTLFINKGRGHFPWDLSNCWRTRPSYYPNFPSHIPPSPFPHWLRYLQGKDFQICLLHVPLNTHTHTPTHTLHKIVLLSLYYFSF